MTRHKPEQIYVGVAVCEKCPDIHLVVLSDGEPVASIAMDRDEWATLIGNYGDMLMKVSTAKGETLN